MSEPITRAMIAWPSENSTIATSAVCTTCAAVKTFPSLEISTPDPKPSTIAMGSSAEGATSTRLVLTMTTDWLTWRKASRSCCAFVVIEMAQNVSRLSIKANGDLVLMVHRNAQQLFQKKNASHTNDSTEKDRKREGFPDGYCVYREYNTRDFTMLFVESRDFLFYPARDVGGS